jgi:hypothetical protein
MTRKSLTGLALVTAIGLAGCAYVGPGGRGNDSGGIFPWSPENQAHARALASEHCARYGRVAHLEPIDARYGQYISFTCYIPRGYTHR